MSDRVVPLASADPDLAVLGGKGASLARLSAAGLPVPPGVVVTTVAYDEAAAGLRTRIADAVGTVDPDRPETAAAAGTTIRALFDDAMPAAIAEEIRAAVTDLGPVAVRSSATAEDLPDASFAGQQDTYLDVRGPEQIIDAVRRCWASLWTDRAIVYRRRRGIDEVSLAVVVQELVDADAAGVAFTRDPVSGADVTVIDAAWGLGDAVVSGAVTPDRVIVGRGGSVRERSVGDKKVRTLRRDGGGTGEDPVPDELREAPVLTDDEAVALAGLARRIEDAYGGPVDVEWARADGRPWIVQARPVTTSAGTEVWNDSLTADRLWTSANLGEAIPSVMTPCTWSLVQIFMAETMSLDRIDGFRIAGSIGGRFYLDLSLAMGAASVVGLGGVALRASEQVFGRIPRGTTVPRLPLSRWALLSGTARSVVPFLRRVRTYQRRLPELLAANPGRCDAVRARIAAAPDPAALRGLWDAEVDPLLRDTSRMLAAGARSGGAALVRIRPRLRRLVGDADTEALLTGLGDAGGEPASLGPVVGLGKLARGEIDRDTFAREYGHRCPDEFEISVPRPAEDPAWVDRLLAGAEGTDPQEMLARRERGRVAALTRLRARSPRQAPRLERALTTAARAYRDREAARSEVIRAFAVLRAFVLRAGELTGHGADLFQLSIDEVRAVLGGDTAPLARVPVRRRTYLGYAALPPYPTLIRGAFDPQRWAADPDRRTDVYDATRPVAPPSDTVTGFPGASGVVVGTARVLRSMADADRLRPGDVLVTTVTNVGWTPLFPRAGAVVTDVGAPLSHAAIVARELGVPAVVGCGNATTRLHDGDTVRVDGAAGTVEVLG